MSGSRRGVVFDLDGTLIESRPAIAASVNYARQQLGYGPLEESEIARQIGWGLEHLLAQLFSAADLPAASDLYRQDYAASCVARTSLLPEVTETLNELDRRGFALGIASNKPAAFTRQIVSGLGLNERFAVVLGGGDVANLKPHPEMLENALSALAVERSAGVFVGDMAIDLETATAAGVPFIAVATGNLTREQLIEAGAERVIGALGELLAQPEVE